MSERDCSSCSRFSCSRREFIGEAVRGAVGCAVAGAGLLAGCSSVRHVRADVVRERVLAVDPADFEDNSGLLVHHDRLRHPIYVHRRRARYADEESDGDGTRDGGHRYTAVLTTCTHRGCQAEPAGGRLICPCHGSQFDHDGSLLDGPAGDPLMRFAVERADGTLLIQLDDEV